MLTINLNRYGEYGDPLKRSYKLKYNFNQLVDNLPNSITYLTFGYKFNRLVKNLPVCVKEIFINKYQLKLIKKNPYNCIFSDINHKQL